MLVLSLLAWAALVAGMGWMVLGYALVFFLFYCFAQSALISYIKGTGVRITHEQFPDLERQIGQCCAKLGLAREPEAYLLQMGGSLNAFATRFLGRDFLVLYSDVVDGLHDNPDALNFYIGHEIGHIKRKHLNWSTVLLPASLLPLVGAAYARARETEGFWMSFHELVGDYPWLVKRMGTVRALAAGREPDHPRRHLLATLLALFVPRLGVAGGGGGVVVTLAMIGILAAVGIPAYQGFQQKAAVAGAYAAGVDASTKVERYLSEQGRIPTLAQAGVTAGGGSVRSMTIDPETAVLRVVTAASGPQGEGMLVFEPSMDEHKKIAWACTAEGILPQAVPQGCH